MALKPRTLKPRPVRRGQPAAERLVGAQAIDDNARSQARTRGAQEGEGGAAGKEEGEEATGAGEAGGGPARMEPPLSGGGGAGGGAARGEGSRGGGPEGHGRRRTEAGLGQLPSRRRRTYEGGGRQTKAAASYLYIFSVFIFMFLVYIYVTARNVKALTARNVYILMFFIY